LKEVLSENDLYRNEGRNIILARVQKKITQFTITSCDIRYAKVRTHSQSTRVSHIKKKEEKDLNAQIPNLMNGATGCDEVLKAFASDTTAMKTVDANNVYKMYYGCGCIDYCSKFFFGAKTSIYNDEILVNYSYKNTPMEKGSILNTDRGKAQISNLNKGLLYWFFHIFSENIIFMYDTRRRICNSIRVKLPLKNN
jgi:hypothetical protein